MPPYHVGPQHISFFQYGLSADAFKRLYVLFGGNGTTFDTVLHWAHTFWNIYAVLAFIASGLFVAGLIYSYVRITQLAELEEEQLLEEEEMWKEIHEAGSGNAHWQEVQQHIASENPNDWKLAIIEADVILEHMLADAGYAGNTISERLRSASSRSFRTVQDAWDAHRVRNQIAHGGADFVLTPQVARNTIVQYQHVFEEFNII